MDHPKLTPSQSAVLFVLMAECRELSTPELLRLGPKLDKPGRLALQRRGLIESHLGARRALFHSLTDRGWAWCAAELQESPPDRALPPMRALYSVLAGIGRYLEGEDLRVHEVFGRPRVTDATGPDASTAAKARAASTPVTDLPGRIVEAYRAVSPTPGALIGIAVLRAEFSEVTASDFDTAIIELQGLPGISVIPQEDQARLSPHDRTAAVLVGTQPCHLFAIEEI